MTNSRKIHIALNVTDVNRSVEFYRAVFGLEPVKWKPGYAKRAQPRLPVKNRET